MGRVDQLARECGGVMAGSSMDPGTQRHKIGVKLRKLRKTRNLTQREVADRLEYSLTKIIRIEKGSVGVSVTDMRALLELYEVTEPKAIEEMTKLARDSHTQSWSEKYRDLITPQYAQYLPLEGSASTLAVFHPFLIPGLLQTAKYAMALAHSHQESAQNHRLAELRMQRQQRVFGKPGDDTPRPPEKLKFLVSEEALHRWIGGPEVMRDQLEHLLEVGTRPNVELKVIPYSAGAHPGLLGPFILLRFRDDDDDEAIVFSEGPGEDLLSRDDPDKAINSIEYFEIMDKLALPEDQADALVTEMIRYFDAVAEDSPGGHTGTEAQRIAE
jgi:transcriptional regulator with XRE-family HTH domain